MRFITDLISNNVFEFSPLAESANLVTSNLCAVFAPLNEFSATPIADNTSNCSSL